MLACGKEATASPSPRPNLVRHRYHSGALALVGFTLLAAVIRFSTLDLQSFSHDEVVTATRVLLPDLPGTLNAIANSERSGPLYYVLAWPWSMVFGHGEAGLRSLSALFGTLAVPVAYLSASEIATRRAALIAAALVAVNPYLVWLSLESRSYVLLTLLSGAGLLLTLRSLNRPTAGNLALWAVVSAASLATHYFSFFLVAPEALWLLYCLRSRPVLAAILGTSAAGAVLLPLAIHQVTRHPLDFAATGPAEKVAGLGPKSIFGHQASEKTEVAGVDGAGLVLAALTLALCLGAVALLVWCGNPKERNSGLLALGVGSCGVVLPVLLAIVGVDAIKEKNLVGVLPPLLVAVAAGFGARNSGHLGLVGGVALVAVFAVGLFAMVTTPRLQNPDWRLLAETLGPTRAPRLIVAKSPADDPLLFYLPGSVDKLVHVREGEAKASEGREHLRMSEIVVVRAGGRPPAVVYGFELMDEASVSEQFEIYRYRANARRRISPSRIEGRRLVGEREFVVLRQAAG